MLEIGKTRPVIFSSNCEDMISPEELDLGAVKLLGEQPGIQTFHLTNRIRANAELSYFIQNMMHLPHGRVNAALSPCRGGLCQRMSQKQLIC
ncbi:MAG: hypothetical protein ACLR8P_06445 [Clostridium fessum]